MTQQSSNTHLQPSALSKRLIDLRISSRSEALAQEVLYNLQYQHRWSDLKVHKIKSLTGSTETGLVDHEYNSLKDFRPSSETRAELSEDDGNDGTVFMISGVPPRHIYIHPDLQKHLITKRIPDTDLDVTREFVLPLSTGRKASLRFFAEVFDALPAPEEIVLSELRNQPSSRNEDTATRREKYRHQDARRVMLGMLARNGVGGDGTITYYIMQEGDVKPRQNG